MHSSAVSSMLYMPGAGGEHAQIRLDFYVYCGGAASSHEWEFRTRLRFAGKTGDHYIKNSVKSV